MEQKINILLVKTARVFLERFSNLLFLLFCYLVLGLELYADSNIKSKQEYLFIKDGVETTFVILDAPQLAKDEREWWPNICGTKDKKPRGLKKILVSGNTRWSNEVVCLADPRSLKQASLKKQKYLTLKLTWRNPQLDFKVDLWFGKRAFPLANYRIILGQNPLEEIKSTKVLDLIAQTLTDASSYGWLAQPQEVEPGLFVFAFKEGLSGLKLPEYLYAFQLETSATQEQGIPVIFKPTLMARLKKIKSGQFSSHKEAESRYVVIDTYRPLRPGSVYHLHTEWGPGGRKEELQKALSASLSHDSKAGFVSDLVFDTLFSNYAGLRIGKSLMLDNLLKKAFLVSALVELRSGPLQGLRWYYDIVPQIKSYDHGVAETFRLARASLGWSFVFQVPSIWEPYLATLAFQPKIGLTDVKTRLAVNSAVEASLSDYQSLSFEARNIIDLAGELGLEQSTPWLRLRLWASIGRAAMGFNNKEGVNVLSARTGLDTYYDLTSSRLPFDASLLGFVMYENLSLAKDPSKVTYPSGVGIKQIDFSTFFIGGGPTISW